MSKVTALYITATNKMQLLKNDESGVTAVEYAIIAVAMTGIILVALTAFGPSIQTMWAQLTADLNSANTLTGNP